MQNSLTFLGTGGASGVPVIGCHCSVCSSVDQKNKRMRSSVYLRIRNHCFLVDVGPDFRQQALCNGIERVDGLILTHTHFDHIAGLDDLRAFYFLTHQPLPCLLSQDSYKELEKRYYYLFEKQSNKSNLKAAFDFQILPASRGEERFLGEKIRYFHYLQGNMQVTGIRIGNFAFVTDIKEYPETIFDDLEGIEYLVLSTSGHMFSHVHFTIEDSLQFAMRIKAKKVWLIHLPHQIEFHKISLELPDHFKLSYDGLQIDLDPVIKD